MARLGKSNSAKPLLVGAAIIALLAAGVYFATAPRSTPSGQELFLTPTPQGTPSEGASDVSGTPSPTQQALELQTPLPERPADATATDATPAPDAAATAAPTTAANSNATPAPEATGEVPIPEATLLPEITAQPTTAPAPAAGY